VTESFTVVLTSSCNAGNEGSENNNSSKSQMQYYQLK
jgi:hypothetical protein